MMPSSTHGARARSGYFASDSTAIIAETLGNALRANFPVVGFHRHTIAFVDTVEGARKVVRDIDASASTGAAPIVFTTIKSPPVWRVSASGKTVLIDLLGSHLTELEAALGTTASEQLGQYRGVGDMELYHARMHAVEYAIEHDNGQGMRTLDLADVVIIGPSRCGKTPTTMYLALQYGLLVANYPSPMTTSRPTGCRKPSRRSRGVLASSRRRSGSARCVSSGSPTRVTPRLTNARESCGGRRTSIAATACCS